LIGCSKGISWFDAAERTQGVKFGVRKEAYLRLVFSDFVFRLL
jgi:hypothetical protein